MKKEKRQHIENLVKGGKLKLTRRAKHGQGNQYEIDLGKELNRVIIVEADNADAARAAAVDQLEGQAAKPDEEPAL